MQTDFSLTQSYIPEWNGNRALPEDEQIKAVLSVIDMGSLMRLVDAFSKTGIASEGKVDTDNIDHSAIQPVLNEFGGLLPQNVKLSNLKGKDGVEVTIEQVVKFPTFLGLALELLMKLMEISSPSEEDVKNLNTPSG